MKPRARLLLASAFALAATGLWFWFARGSSDESVALRTVAMKTLAEHLAKQFPKQRVLVLANPFIHNSRQPKSIRVMEETSVNALKKELGGANVVMGFPQLRPGAWENPQSFVADPESTTPLSFLVAPDAIDSLVKEHGECKLIVSLIGLPVELNRVSAWTDTAGPRFALLLPDLRMIGSTSAVVAAMRSGKLVAFVLSKPGANLDERFSGGDAQMMFDRHFLLVTLENIESLARAHPKLFESVGEQAR